MDRKEHLLMNERTLCALEYDKIIDMLAENTATTLGKSRVLKLHPETDIERIEQMQLETDEAVQILRHNLAIPFGGITDIQKDIHRTTIGGMLQPEQLLSISNTLYGSRNVKQFIEKLEIEVPLLDAYVEDIAPLRSLETAIHRIVDDMGEVQDHASSNLRSIRSTIRSLEGRVREKLQQFTKSHSSHLSEDIITIRNNRYVLPVKSESRGAIGGIVHDQSSSGQTLFMEPRAVVEMNNTLQQAFLKEQTEIEHILRKISREIAEHANEIDVNIKILSMIDFIYARALLARKMRASMPTMNTTGVIQMKQARHPLIKDAEVVANDIELGTSFSAIVITGPNTGGKTVTLKLIGLCTLMAQSGLQIPALDGCELAVFHHVFADIGDEQSIEQNLSTFSSHMTNIVSIMEQVDEKSLVLFDELGSGTDPQEGAALAMALLDEVLRRNASVIATTHYPELKAFGYNRDRVLNASVEFNVETLQPTYRLLLGVPGRSNAFDISKRLGLSEDIILEAKSYIDTDSTNVNEMIQSLEQSTSQAMSEYDEAAIILEESKDLHSQLQQKWQEFERKKERLFERAEEKAQHALEKAQEEAESIVKDLRQKRAESSFKEHEWIEAKKQLEQQSLGLTTEKKEQPQTEKSILEPGDEIILTSVNQKGSVIERLKDDEYVVQVGIMKVTVKRDELTRVFEPTKKEPTFTTVRGRGASSVRTELDLRGQRFEDALVRLERYLDDAILASHGRVEIIHGKGTGALRKGVQKYLKTHPHVQSYRMGEMNEGGSGVTIVHL